MVVVFYISGHGFGHAARDIQIVNALAKRDAAVRCVIRTSVPRWFLDASLERPVDVLPGDTDTGLVQPDSLSIDEDATARRAAMFYRDFTARVAAERHLIQALGASLVVGDVPPLAFAAAAAAGVPSVAVGNFTWDWIYEAYSRFEAAAPGVRALIAEANAQASLALRLPFAGGFASMPRVEDVPLVARRATVARAEVRRRLELPSDRPLVLATFGGHGGHVPLAQAARSASFTLMATDYEVGDRGATHPNLRVVSTSELQSNGLAYTDLLAASDVAATKLGYGIVSECLANDVALLYALRGHFVEQDVFMREMPAVMRSQHIDRDDLRTGRWDDAIDALLSQPTPPRHVNADGADLAAERILRLASRTDRS